MAAARDRKRVSVRGDGARSGLAQTAPVLPAAARANARRALRGGSVTVLALLVVAGGVGLTRARYGASPVGEAQPSAHTWEHPDPASDTRETEARLLEEVRRTVSNPRPLLALARFYLEDAKPFEAIWVLREAQQLDARSLQARLLLARALAARQLYQSAREQLKAAIQDHPQSVAAAQQLASLLLSLGRPAEAVSVLLDVEKRQPLPAGAVLLLGRALEASGQDREALRRYRLYQQLDSRSEQGYLRLGKLMLRMGKAQEARQALLAAMRLNQLNAEARHYLGLLELQRGPSHEETARQRFLQAIASDESFAPAHFELGAYYQRHRDWERASSTLKRAFLLDEENAEALLRLSQVRRAMGDVIGASYYRGLYYDTKSARPRATAQYESLVAARDQPRAVLLVSQALVKMDQKLRAAEVLRNGLRRHPGDRELMERLIAIDLLTGNHGEVEQLCRDWIEQEPAASQPVWLLGRVRLDKHDWEGALKLFRQAAQSEPGNAEYPFAIGSAYMEKPSLTHWDMAARHFGRAVTLQPDEPRYRLNLGMALQKLGQLNGARRQYLRALDLDVNQSAPLNNIVQVARGLKQYGQVEFWAPLVHEVEERLRQELPGWKRVWDNPSDVEGYLQLAQFLKSTGELGKARNILEQAVALRPDLDSARRELALLERTLDIL